MKKLLKNKEELLRADMFKLVSKENNKKVFNYLCREKKYGIVELVS